VAVVAPHGVAVTVVALRGAAVAITVVVVVVVGGGAMVRPRGLVIGLKKKLAKKERENAPAVYY
jgi:hypothetical protein